MSELSEPVVLRSDMPPPEYTIVLAGADGKMLVGVRNDGSVEFGEKYSVEPAARLLWQTFSCYLPLRPKLNGMVVDFEPVTNFGALGEYITAVVSFDTKREGRGTSRSRANAVAYALEDLAKQVKEQGYP